MSKKNDDNSSVSRRAALKKLGIGSAAFLAPMTMTVSEANAFGWGGWGHGSKSKSSKSSKSKSKSRSREHDPNERRRNRNRSYEKPNFHSKFKGHSVPDPD